MAPKNSITKSEELAANSALELELPDWSGMVDSSQRITPEAALQLCDEYIRLIGEMGMKERNRESNKCTVEFVL